MTIVSFPVLYFLIGFILRLAAYLSCKNYKYCWMYDRDSIVAYILPILGICNALLINLFMLRVFHVAAILKCETKEEEVQTEKWINYIRFAYLPSYFIIKVLIFLTELAIFTNRPFSPVTFVSLIVILNMLKECLTATLGIYVLIFAYRLQNIIEELKFTWGNSPPAIARLRTLRNYLLMMGLTYLLVDVLYSVVFPAFEVTLVLEPNNDE